MKIKSITLKNFQSHKLTRVNFDDGVTALVGENDQGKSSILRGLYWLTFNRPLGDEFRSNWGGDTVVEVTTEDNSIIKRVKTDSKNQYWLNEEVFEGFGTSVPEPIQNALNLSELNFSTARETPFLIHSEAGEVGRFFNKAVNLEIIDKVQSHAGLRTKRIRREMVFTQEALKEKEEELKELSWVRKAEGEVVDVSSKINELEHKKKFLEFLDGVNDDLTIINHNIADLRKFTRLSERVDKLWGRWSALEERQNKWQELLNTKESLELLSNWIEKNKKVLKLQNKVLYLDSDYKDWEMKKKKLLEFQLTKMDLEEKNAAIIRHKRDLKEYEEKFHELMPDICPLCGRGD